MTLNITRDEAPITPEDEARYMEIMAGYDKAMLEHQSHSPVPMCHFKPMIHHWDDSHPAVDDSWYECEYCGHIEDSDKAWAKVRALQAKKQSMDSETPAKKPIEDEIF